MVKETRQDEKRVALIPSIIKSLVDIGVQVSVEADAGKQSGFSDQEYSDHGAEIIHDKQQLYHNADIALWLKRPADESRELDYLSSDSLLVGFLDPLKKDGHVEAYSDKQLTTFSWELLPSTEETQAMNAFAKMGVLAGEIACQNALHSINVIQQKAVVLVIGTGNAGLAAAREAFNAGHHIVMLSTNQQFASLVTEELLGEFILLQQSENPEKTLQQQQQQLHSIIHSHQPDAIITTARRYGQCAPILITDEALRDMKSGSVIEDLTASIGGNTVFTELDKQIKLPNEVLIRNQSNYPSQDPTKASEYYAKSAFHLIQHIKQHKEADNHYDISHDPLLHKAILTHQGHCYL